MVSFKTLSLILAIAGATFTPAIWAGWTDFSFYSYQFEGKVKAIATGQDIKIRLANVKDESKIEVFKLCEYYSASPKLTMTLGLLKDAMKTGQVVQINYNSVFNRCLRDVQVVVKEPKIAKK